MSKTKSTNADVIKKLEEEAKARKAAEAEKSAAQTKAAPALSEPKPIEESEGGEVNPPDEPLSPEAQAEADRIMASDEGANTEEDVDTDAGKITPPANPNVNAGMASASGAVSGAGESVVSRAAQREAAAMVRSPAYEKVRAAGQKLRSIALDYPLTTPDEQVVFGRGGITFTLGDLRDLTQVPR